MPTRRAFISTFSAGIIGLAMGSAGCRKKRTSAASSLPPAPRRGRMTPEAAREALKAADGETGIASWYGKPYDGRPAANGEIYDMEKLTAAHRTLPFGTWVRVTNLSNGKSVDVRITDRGPFINGRIIDLSKAGARAIDMIGPGTAQVRLHVVQAPADTAAAGLFAVQVGAFQDRARAEDLRASLASDFNPVRVVERRAAPVFWRVLVGEAHTLEEANTLAAQVQSRGGQAFVVSLEGVSLTAAGGADASSPH
ncbi:MAG TPA: septal ring lytic transglycosylase RlpA family protein [Bryobacteraceae bacterium]|nr:septal ring lytic transglycosylase RlpA family protein [Bryobacteraceae bacterium]